MPINSWFVQNSENLRHVLNAAGKLIQINLIQLMQWVFVNMSDWLWNTKNPVQNLYTPYFKFDFPRKCWWDLILFKRVTWQIALKLNETLNVTFAHTHIHKNRILVFGYNQTPIHPYCDTECKTNVMICSDTETHEATVVFILLDRQV